ncbi:MAG: DMT family transporter [Anaerolineae bacterium]|nr:DMT family transporter [Anaerolineae bacterium]
MQLKNTLMLLSLAAVWGASFLFVRIAAPILGPLPTTFLRVFIAALVLLAYINISQQPLNLKQNWKIYAGMGLFNAAIPFTLFAVAMLNLNASYSSILNATTAFFTAITASVWLKETLTRQKLLGVFLGILGVFVLVGLQPVALSFNSILSVLLILLATFSYGIAAVFAKIKGKGISPATFAAGQQLCASIIMLPMLVIGLPITKAITIEVVIAIAGVSIICTAVAYLLYYRLIANIGPTNALTVTFLIPAFGVAWGNLFLGEAISWNVLFGSLIILLGMALVLGKLNLQRQR